MSTAVLTGEVVFISLQAQFEQLENEMKDSNANYEALMKGYLELTELKHIMRKTHTFFEEVQPLDWLKFRLLA